MAFKRSVRRPEGRIDYVVNRSSRRGVEPSVIFIHTTESHDRPGRQDVDSIHAWFDNPASGASSHVIVGDGGESTTCVPDEEKAWTQVRFNPVGLSIELIGWASTPRWRWLKREKQLNKAAKFMAYWSKKYDIPLRRGSAYAGEITKTGVLAHSDLGAAGGGHHDPGPGFPMDRLIQKALYYKSHGWY